MKLRSFCLENDFLKVRISPTGGKILSLMSKETAGEWLFQSESGEFEIPSDGSFTKDVAFGWDEMFPTIIAEKSLQADGRTVEYPDHGDLWSREWSISAQEGDTVTMNCSGDVIPYEFERSCRLEERRLICLYKVSNLSDRDIPALWTPHPLFSFFEETEIGVPADCRRITQAMDGGPLGAYGRKSEWDEEGFVEGAGKLLRPGSLEKGSAFKFYGSDPLDEGVFQMKDRRGVMTFSYPADQMPWLGFWINKGGWSGHHNLAPEPATAPFDSPARSEAAGVAALWKAGETKEWEIVCGFAAE